MFVVGPNVSKTVPDEITPAQLARARALLEGLCRINTDFMDSETLAERVQGVARAVASFIVANGAAEFVGLRPTFLQDVDTTPLTYTGRTFEHYEDPNTRLGGMFTAHCSRESGALLTTYDLRTTGTTVVSDVMVPSDEKIDALLMRRPARFWTSREAWLREGDDTQSAPMYPFDYRSRGLDAPQQYLQALQHMTGTLLSVTG